MRPTEPRFEVTEQTAGGGGVLSGVFRAVQTLPAAVENLVSRSGGGRPVPGNPGLHDSVEYASVRSSAERPPPPPAEAMSPATPLFEPRTLERMQRLHESAPLFYPSEAARNSSPPRPPSTSSNDVQAEVRRQLLELMAARDEESRRLKAQVEALSMENRSLRLRAESTVQLEMQGSRQNQAPKIGFPSLGWIGRGLGTLIGQPRPQRDLDLAEPSLSREQGGAPPAMDFSASNTQPRLAVEPHEHLRQWQIAVPVEPPPPNGSQCSGPAQAYHQASAPQAIGVPVAPRPPPMPRGSVQGVLGIGTFGGLGFPRVEPTLQALPEQAYPKDPNFPQYQPPPGFAEGPAGEAVGPAQAEPEPLDPLNVVLTGMAQLQSVVTELTSPKATSSKPEVIKPGVTSLPDLPGHGPESSLAFADWLHASRPALADVSDTSEELWQRTIDEATAWYNQYLKMDPLARLTAKPAASIELAQPKWTRVSRRIETMIIAAAPKDVRDELSASRTSGLLPLLTRLFIIYGPGTLMERELGLRHISEPPVGATVPEVIETLRRWKRWCARMTELGGVLPDPSIQVRALTKATKAVLTQHPDIAFRVNLIRASLQIDVTPDNAKVMKLHAQMLAELEAISHRGEKARVGDKEQSAQASAKIKKKRRRGTGTGPAATSP